LAIARERPVSSRLVVDVPMVPDVNYEDAPSRVVYLVDDAVVTDPNPPAVAADKFAAALWPRVTGQRPNCVADPLERWR